MVNVVSQLTGNGHPIYGSCTIHMHGEQVVFEQGRAQVSEELAARLLGRDDMVVLATAAELPVLDTESETPDLEYENPPSEDSPPPASPEDHARDEARRALLADGADVPEFPIPSGFATHTEDEQRRCLAAKADGEQCANVAKDGGWACGLEKHVESVSALPRELP